MNERTEELIELQRKIAAYRNVQHDTTRQLYGVTSALLSHENRALDAVLRQLSQFGYDLDRLQHVAQDEVELLASALRKASIRSRVATSRTRQRAGNSRPGG
jgi:succinylarginine dihydrolase